MKIKTCINYVLLCAAVASSTSLAGESNLVLRAKGPISASPQGQTIDVLGTSYAVSADAKVILDGSNFRYGKESASQLTASSAPLVEIYSQGIDGPVKLVRTISGERYVPGSTSVAIHGVVGWSNPSLGMLKIGKTLVNYSAALAANPQFAPQIGDEVVIDGFWTDPNSPVVAHHAVAAGTATTTNENAASINKATPHPITTLGISGSGVISNGISGSGVISSGISGSGAKATARPVTTLGISGSGVISNGISGSGVVSTGISGSGAKATVRPVTTLGISGSGFISNGISGSGVISTGISGSGAKATTRPITTLGISGSGVISIGISGSGVVSTGISGSGAKATVRPVTTLGISGSGVISNGISGSGIGSTH